MQRYRSSSNGCIHVALPPHLKTLCGLDTSTLLEHRFKLGRCDRCYEILAAKRKSQQKG